MRGPKLIRTKVIYCIFPEMPLSRRQQALRKRIEGSVLQTAATEGAIISEDEVRRRIYVEEARKKVGANLGDFAIFV